MTITLETHYLQLLGLTEPWQVTAVDLDLMGNRVTIDLAWREGAPVTCPDCGREGPVHDLREERRWRHLSVMQFETQLRCRVPRCRCPEHGIKTVRVPWAEPGSHFTLMFEAFAIRVLEACPTLQRATQLLGIDWHTALAIKKRAVERGLQRRELDEIPFLCIDEKSFRGREMCTTMSDPIGQRLLEVTRGCNHQAVQEVIGTLPAKVQADVMAVAVDMSAAMAKGVRLSLPEADIVHDRFHVSKLLNEAVEQVRRQEAKAQKLGETEVPAPSLQRSRYLFLINPENQTKEQRKRFRPLRDSELKVAKVWAAKNLFRRFWTYTYPGAARRFFSNWITWARSLRIAPLTRVANTLESRYAGLESYLFHRVTNATAEAFHSLIQSLKTAARGYRNFTHFRVAALFRLGRLSMMP